MYRNPVFEIGPEPDSSILVSHASAYTSDRDTSANKIINDRPTVGWRRSMVVRTLISAGELSPSCARLLAGWVTTLWLSLPLSDSQHGRDQLSHPSLMGR